MTRGGYNPRRGAEKHVKLVLTLPPAEKAAIVEAAKGAPSVSAWVLARCAPPMRDPRVDPRAGDVVWVREAGWLVVDVSDRCVRTSTVDTGARTSVSLTGWRERMASADVLRVAP